MLSFDMIIVTLHRLKTFTMHTWLCTVLQKSRTAVLILQ